jgi:enamine deaminase RidA (YjgF/YER057c/UK114 family)
MPSAGRGSDSLLKQAGQPMQSEGPPIVEDVSIPLVSARLLRRNGYEEMFATAALDGHASGEDAAAALARFVCDRDASVISTRVMGLRDASPAGRTMVDDAFPKVAWPVTWLDEGCGSRPPLAGIQLQAIVGADVTPLALEGAIVGSVYEDDYARYCKLGGELCDDASLPRAEQGRRAFERMEKALELADMTFRNVVRTWFWIDDILGWYGDFNKVRTTFYEKHGVFDHFPPASTGIGAHNAAGTALSAELIAMEPKRDNVTAFAVDSPLQCPAPSYGSSFSRAAEISTPGYSHLFVSGTASIAANGETIHQGDVEAQIARSMEVVGAILHSRGMEWADVTRSIAYFRSGECAPAFDAYRRQNGLQDMPAIVLESVICRDELLFEIEVDAVLAR